jgi:hypothetical protein
MTHDQPSDSKLIMLALAELLERTTQLQHAKILESMMNESTGEALAPTSMLAHDLRKRARELP